MPIEAGTICVFDKAYCDYAWWHDIERVGATFVTRFKKNTRLAPTGSLARHRHGDKILKDEMVRFSNPSPGGGRKNPYRVPLRRVTVARPGEPLVLADLDSPSGQYHCRILQGALANRTVLQMDQAAPEPQNLFRTK